MRVSRLPVAAALAGVLALLVAAPVAAFDLSTPCNLALESSTEGGQPLDGASGRGPGGTYEDPFIIDWEGTVSYVGSTGGQVIMDHAWHIDVFLIPTPLRGGDPNEGGDQDAEDTVDVSDNAPFKFSGLYFVSGDIAGAGGSCSGSGWFKLDESPWETVGFWTAVVIALIGLLLIAWSLPTRRPVPA